MKTTKKQTCKISLIYPDGTRIEARIPEWKAYYIVGEIKRKEELKREEKRKAAADNKETL